MSYDLYTLPNCEHCREAKIFLDEKGIEYREINVTSGEGKKDFGQFYRDSHEFIERTDKGIERTDKGIVFPVFVEWSEDRKRVEQILQNSDKIKELLSI